MSVVFIRLDDNDMVTPFIILKVKYKRLWNKYKDIYHVFKISKLLLTSTSVTIYGHIFL